MKIGIPRSLFYYYFKDIWINFFKYLKIDIIISPPTNKEIMDFGMKYSQDEICLSLKNYIGHVMYLKDKCDYIIVPRIDNYGGNNQTCTNFLAIYDIINNLNDIKLLNYNVNLENNETELSGFISLKNKLNKSKTLITSAYQFALEKSNEIRQLKIIRNIENLNCDNKKILIVGHPYNIYDKLIGNPIIKILEDLNVKVVYCDYYENSSYVNYCKGLYWKYSKENINGISKYKNLVNGIIFLSSFPCGIDSLVNELVMRKLDVPYLNLVIDDNYIDGGIETRLESFVDILNFV